MRLSLWLGGGGEAARRRSPPALLRSAAAAGRDGSPPGLLAARRWRRRRGEAALPQPSSPRLDGDWEARRRPFGFPVADDCAGNALVSCRAFAGRASLGVAVGDRVRRRAAQRAFRRRGSLPRTLPGGSPPLGRRACALPPIWRRRGRPGRRRAVWYGPERLGCPPPPPPDGPLSLGRRSRVRPRAWRPMGSPEVALGIAVQPGLDRAFCCPRSLPRRPRPRQPLPPRPGALLLASAYDHGQVSRWRPVVALSARVSTRSWRWSEPGHDLVRPGHCRANRLRPVVVRPATAVVALPARAMSLWSRGRTRCRPRRGHFHASGQGADPREPSHGLVLVRSATAARAICSPWLRGWPRPHARPAGAAVARARPRPHARPAGHGRVSCLCPVVTQPATTLTWPRRLRELGHGLVLPSTVTDVNGRRKVSNW